MSTESPQTTDLDLYRVADDLDRKLFDLIERAYFCGWFDVAGKLEAARGALRPKMHPADVAAMAEDVR